ncbi:MAG: ATP-binding cassette domain-containing protein, partial [Bacilli bacterium]|nr:ATP-binding cassette domain-containing protein [Bacilli bacterium]
LLKGMKEKEAKTRAKELIEKVGLTDRIKSKAINLSGGEKQRTVIARALATDSPILACDEITGNLDSKTGDEIINLIKEVSKDKLVLMVTHNLEQCESIITRKIRLSDGVVVEDTNLSQEDNATEEELLDKEKKAPAHALGTITKWNIKNTPKKTIFSTIVMYAISFVVVFLLSLGTFLDSYVNFGNYSPYSSTFDDRLIVHNIDHSPVNKADFSSFAEDSIVYNSMVEEYYFTIDQTNAFQTFGYVTKRLEREIKSNIFEGREPKYENEILICASSRHDDIFNYYTIGKQVDLGANLYAATSIRKQYTLVGFSYSPKVNQYEFVLDKDAYNSLQDELYMNNFSNRDFGGWQATVSYDMKTSVVDRLSDPTITKPVVRYTGNSNIKVEYIDVPVFDIYNVRMTDFTLINTSPSNDIPQVYSVTVPANYVPDDVFEVTIYSDNVNKVSKEMKEKGYDVIIPAKEVSKTTLNTTMSKYFVIISLVAGFVLNLVAYVVISRIYDYKIKEFAVFRSLGYLKSSMSKIVHFEMTLIGMVSLVFGIATIPLLGLGVQFFQDLTSCMNVWWILLSIAIVLLLSNFLAWRLNRRIFKQTLVKTFKSEEAK